MRSNEILGVWFDEVGLWSATDQAARMAERIFPSPIPIPEAFKRPEDCVPSPWIDLAEIEAEVLAEAKVSNWQRFYLNR